MRQRLREAFVRWAVRRHDAGSSTLLGQRNVYVLPTPAGWFFALTLLVLLLGSINYQLNLGYLFTFALAGSALMSLHVTHGNLRGVRLALPGGEPPEAFAARECVLRLRLLAARGARWGLQARLDTCDARTFDLEPGRELELALPWLPRQRGQQPWPALLLETRYPLGLWRAWSVWRPPQRLWVYPAPLPDAPALPRPRPLAGAGTALRRGSGGEADELDELRGWRQGDALRRVVWRKSLGAEWIVRDAPAHASAREQLCLDWDALAPGLDAETRLQQLCAWVVAARALDLAYELRLPGQLQALGHGPEHARDSLRRLAAWGRDDEEPAA